MIRDKALQVQPFDSMLYFYGKVQEPRIRCLLRFQDHIDETILKRAVDLSMKAVPLLGCVFDELSHSWKQRDFSAEDILHVVDAVEENADIAQRYLLRSLDHTCEPQLKIFLIREKQNDTLCVIINHLVCDGAGFKAYLYLLSELYTRCEQDAEYNTPSQLSADRSFHQILRNFSITKKLRILTQKTVKGKANPAMILPITGDAANPFIITRQIEKEQFSLLRGAAKSRNASVNDVLLAAYIRTLHRATGHTLIAIPVPVDLRKFGKANQPFGICNLTGTYWCSVEMRSGEPFDDTLRKVSRQMQAQKAGTASLKAPMLFHVLYRMLPYAAVRRIFNKVSPIPVTSYTNIGILDAQQLCLGSHTAKAALISTAIKQAPYFQLTVCTYQGNCILSSSMYGSESDRTFIGVFLDDIVNEFAEI